MHTSPKLEAPKGNRPRDDIYVYVGSGVLVWRFVLYLTLADDGAVEVLDIEVDGVDDECTDTDD